MTSSRTRLIGAFAGLVPAALVVGYYLVTGGPLQPGILAFIASPVIAGWLVGPRLGVPGRAPLAGATYAVVAYLLQAGLGIAVTAWNGGRGLVGFLEAFGTGAVVSIIYAPLWAVVLVPLALVWVLTARVLSARVLPPSWRRRWDDPEPDQQGTRRPPPGSLLWSPAAAVIAYILGFMVTAPSTCTATQSVGGTAVGDTMTVCSSLIGSTYSEAGPFDPPRDLAVAVGLTLAAVAGLVVLGVVLWMRRTRPGRRVNP